MQFDANKLGDAEIAKGVREQLERAMNYFHSALIKVCEAYNEHISSYTDSMKRSLDGSKSPFDQGELLKLHQSTKQAALTQVRHSIYINGLI